MAEGNGDWVQRVERAMEGTIHQQLTDLVDTARESLSGLAGSLSGQDQLTREALDRLTAAVETARAEQNAVESRLETLTAGLTSQIDAVREAVAAVPIEVAVVRDTVGAIPGQLDERNREAREETARRLADLGEWVVEAAGRADEAGRTAAALAERMSAAFAEAEAKAHSASAELAASIRAQMTDLRRAIEQTREEERRAASEREQAFARRLDDLARRFEAALIGSPESSSLDPAAERAHVESLVESTFTQATNGEHASQ